MNPIKPIAVAFFAFLLTACASVSKEEYQALKEQSKKDKRKLAIIDYRIQEYNKRLAELKRKNDSLQLVDNLELDFIEDFSASALVQRENILDILEEVDEETISKASTYEDSLNIAVNHQLDKSIEEFKKMDVTTDKAVVMLILAESFLFEQGKTEISKEARWFLTDLAQVLKKEPSIDLMVEGHTDNIPTTFSAKDNWELSLKRSAEVVRTLQKDYGIDPKRLIPTGRSSYVPIGDNATEEGRAKNRRIRFILIPDLNEFLGILDTENEDQEKE